MWLHAVCLTFYIFKNIVIIFFCGWLNKKKNNPKNIQTKIIRFYNLENDSSLFIYVYKKSYTATVVLSFVLSFYF